MPDRFRFGLRLAPRLKHLDATGALYRVNEYLTNKACGGPEEDGRYYPVGTFETCHGTSFPTAKGSSMAHFKRRGKTTSKHDSYRFVRHRLRRLRRASDSIFDSMRDCRRGYGQGIAR